MKVERFRQYLQELGVSKDCLETVVPDLELMATYKYDYYEMYNTASRFFENVLSWLAQFDLEDRETVLNFIRYNLIFISQREMQDLARFLYYDRIVPEILKYIIEKEKLEHYDYAKAFTLYFKDYLRKCIFIGLSDGAKIDFFRRHNIDLSQEQVLPYYRASTEDYISKLREETKKPENNFWGVFLIDDFIGSGYTLVHEDFDATNNFIKFDGALLRVHSYHKELLNQADKIFLCHYIATEKARDHVKRITLKIEHFSEKVQMLSSLVLSNNIGVNTSNNAINPIIEDMVKICEKYYNPSYEDVNTQKLGGIKFGFGGQGLPLILYSNTPNNSIYLLWHNTNLDTNSKFVSLFERINRHRPK